MMPIFFHAKAHLWIAYTLFFNGILLTLIFTSLSPRFEEIVETFEAKILSSFAFSLSLNSLVLLVLDYLNQPFSNAIYPLLTVSVVLLIVVTYSGAFKEKKLGIDLLVFPLYIFMFIVLFYNGGLIDQISDAWWHMSLANQIGIENTLTGNTKHLTGLPERYYPPLWHGNLALIREISGIQLPTLWNAFTAWGGVLKLMGFYLLGLGVFADRKIAFLGAVLFALLPGLGNSYMRVSAWPSHVSYSLWFFSLFLTFGILDSFKTKKHNLITEFKHLWQQRVLVCMLVLIILLMYFLHQFEVLLLFTSVTVYLFVLALKNGEEHSHNRIKTVYLGLRLVLFALLFFAIYKAFTIETDSGIDAYLLRIFPVIISCILIVLHFAGRLNGRSKFALLFALAGLLLLSINFQHVASLFVPELALPRGASHTQPMIAMGWFGGELSLPGWHHQLRMGLLWSGVIAFIVSAVMIVGERSRGWVFVAANCIFVWSLILSPYIYHWFSVSLNYHSVWRFAMLSFHPLVIAAMCIWAIRYIRAALA